MSESTGKKVFAAVVALVVLVFAAFTFWPGSGEPAPAGPAAPAPVGQVVIDGGDRGPDGSGAPGSPVPGVDGARVTAPVSDEDLAIAAGQAVTFVRDYNTFTYETDSAEWVERIRAQLASDSPVDLGVLPQGPSAQTSVSEKRTSEVSSVASVTASTMSNRFATFWVSYTVTTTANGAPTDTADEVGVVMTRVGGAGSEWKVAQFQTYAEDLD